MSAHFSGSVAETHALIGPLLDPALKPLGQWSAHWRQTQVECRLVQVFTGTTGVECRCIGLFGEFLSYGSGDQWDMKILGLGAFEQIIKQELTWGVVCQILTPHDVTHALVDIVDNHRPLITEVIVSAFEDKVTHIKAWVLLLLAKPTIKPVNGLIGHFNSDAGIAEKFKKSRSGDWGRE